MSELSNDFDDFFDEPDLITTPDSVNAAAPKRPATLTVAALQSILLKLAGFDACAPVFGVRYGGYRPLAEISVIETETTRTDGAPITELRICFNRSQAELTRDELNTHPARVVLDAD